jgi:hypothetical protein
MISTYDEKMTAAGGQFFPGLNDFGRGVWVRCTDGALV